MLDRDTIFSRNTLKRETVTVPEWGGDVIVSEMTGAARDAWELSLGQRDHDGNLYNTRAKLVAACVVDESGNLIFTKPGDVEKLGKLSSTALDKVCQAAQRLNGLTQEALEEAEGN